MVKIEEGLCEGRVMYHSHVAKTPEEAAALQQHHESKNAIRAQRRMQQVRVQLRQGCVCVYVCV